MLVEYQYSDSTTVSRQILFAELDHKFNSGNFLGHIAIKRLKATWVVLILTQLSTFIMFCSVNEL